MKNRNDIPKITTRINKNIALVELTGALTIRRWKQNNARNKQSCRRINKLPF